MKRIYSILLALCVSSMLSAQLSIWDGTDDVWTKGAGTESSPYLIESAQQLAFISSMVNGGVTTYESTYFKLMTNIDLNNLTWVPIGESETKCFKGHFDGNNKTIINGSTALFGTCHSATICRLNIEMFGFAYSLKNSILKYCSYIGDTTMIAGTVLDSKISNIRCCVNVPNVLGLKCAGIANYANSSTFVTCRMYGNITTKYRNGYSTYDVKKSILVAGIVAESEKCRYEKCTCYGDISTWGSTKIHYDFYGIGGGIIAYSSQDTLSNCSDLGCIKSTGYRYYECIGGLVGVSPDVSSTIPKTSILNSYSIDSTLYYNGKLTAVPTEMDYGQYITAPVVSNSYSRTDKTEQAMKSASFPIVLNTDSTVFIKDITPSVNDGYPIYVNQVYSVTDTLTTIGFTTAQLLGHYYALNADSIGFEYKEANDNTHWYKSVSGQASDNIITCDLSDLKVGTNYIYRVWVERDGVRYFGDVISFTTLECDKTVTSLEASICQGEEYTFNDQQLTKGGAYRDTLVATNGCDSIIELTLTVMPTANIDKYDTIMVGDSYDFYGEILTVTGDYEHYVPMAEKCNLIIMHLYVRQPDVTLTVNVNDPNMGNVEGAGSYEKYTERTITAVPNEGYHFVQWNDGNFDNPRTIVLTQDITFTAQFAINQYAVTVSCDPQQGSIEGKSGTFNHGTELTYKAIANEGYHFVQWSDGNTDNPRTIVLTEETTISAEFAINVYLVQFFGFNEVLLSSQDVEHGTAAVAPEAPKVDHYDFVGWDKEFTNITSNLDVYALYEKNTEGVENVTDYVVPQKIVVDGQVLIHRGDKLYTLQGQEVK